MAPLKILQVCALDTTAETMLQPLLLALQNAGHDVGIACADTGASVKLRSTQLLLEFPGGLLDGIAVGEPAPECDVALICLYQPKSYRSFGAH